MVKLAAAVLLCISMAPAADNAGTRLWSDPGQVEAMDFGGAMGTPVGLPRAPFLFLREDLTGTQAKIFIRDAAGTTWDVKFGNEVKTESFCWRVVRACGYFAEANFFVPEGKIDGVKGLKRTSDWLHADGRFTDGRFQYRDPKWKFLGGKNWRWDFPPLAGTRELSGLKILIMLFSNWDNKDGRVGRGSPNTGVFEFTGGRKQQTYAFTDWGSGMGRWGATDGQTNWRCADFTAQTPEFVLKVERDRVVFGWGGAIGPGFQDTIPPAHVAWLMRYLGRISGDQFRAGLKASGATEAEVECFTKALLDRIEQLRTVAF